MPQSQNADKPVVDEEEPHNNHDTPGRQTKKTISSLFLIVTIAKLEWTQSNAQQNIEQLQNLQWE